MAWARAHGGRYVDWLLANERNDFPAWGFFPQTGAPSYGPAWLFDYAFEIPYRGYDVLIVLNRSFDRYKGVGDDGDPFDPGVPTEDLSWWIQVRTPPFPGLTLSPNTTGHPYSGPTAMDRLLRTRLPMPVHYTGDYAFDTAHITLTDTPAFARDVLTARAHGSRAPRTGRTGAPGRFRVWLG